MSGKQRPLGVCDFCGEPIPRGDWYTSKGLPRLHCSLNCRQTANSRTGSPARAAKARERIKAGLWKNPREGLDPETISEIASAAAQKARRREVAEGRWRNPALSEGAREKLSRPRKHGGLLHAAIEKLRTGSMQDLTADEQEAYHAYRLQLRNARRNEVNRRARERYQDRQARLTVEQRAVQRKKWRRQGKKRRALRP